MVKVGTVYKSNGNIDITQLSFRIKMSIFIHNMIDSSYLLSGNRINMKNINTESEKIYDYTKVILYYLKRSSYRNRSKITMSYDINDEEFVKTALGHPSFFEYSKSFIAMETNLVELKAFNSGVVILRRLE